MIAAVDEQVGKLAVRILKAHDLVNKDPGWFGDVSDPYTVAKVGHQEHKTPSIKNNLSPEWSSDNEFVFAVGKDDTVLELQVCNANMIHSQSLGGITMEIGALRPGKWLRFREPLHKVSSGELEFEVNYEVSRCPSTDSRRAPGLLRNPRSSSGDASAVDVFRRLSASPVARSLPDVQLSLGSSPGQHLSYHAAGHFALGTLSSGGCLASDYLGRVLEERERETGQPATGSRRSLHHEDQELEPPVGYKRRVSEGEAKKIFDRLYQSGKDHRTKRQSRFQLGLLAQESQEREACPFEPNLRSTHQGFQRSPQAGEDVSRRLHEEAKERRLKREQAIRQAPVPPFHPQTTASAGNLAAVRKERDNVRTPDEYQFPNGALNLSPRDTIAESFASGTAAEVSSSALGDISSVLPPPGQPQHGIHFGLPHDRLFREHKERRARQAQREVEQAEWRRHTYRPDIRSSQASGPQIMRLTSASGGTVEGDVFDESNASATAALAGVGMATVDDGELLDNEALHTMSTAPSTSDGLFTELRFQAGSFAEVATVEFVPRSDSLTLAPNTGEASASADADSGHHSAPDDSIVDANASGSMAGALTTIASYTTSSLTGSVPSPGSTSARSVVAAPAIGQSPYIPTVPMQASSSRTWSKGSSGSTASSYSIPVGSAGKLGTGRERRLP